MTTASTPIIPDYAQPTAAGGFVTQTLALFVDAYRELNAKKLFWIVLILSVVVVAGFATMGINERGVTLFKLEFPGAWNTNLITKGEFYKMLFVIFAIPIWLAWLATILAIISTSSIFPTPSGELSPSDGSSAFSSAIASRTASAARTARSASSSCARG